MKKIFAFLFSLLALCGTEAVAQTPTEMQYQLLVLNPETGQVRASQEVQVRIELRQGSETGQAVCSHEQTATTDARGLCNLTLDFGKNIDWNETYYLAAIIDGEYCGAPKLTSVPYALQAARLEGMITAKELVGTWRNTEYYNGEVGAYYERTFNADGTGTASFREAWENGQSAVCSFTWKLNSAGQIMCKESWERSVGESFVGEYFYQVINFDGIYNIVPLNDGSVFPSYYAK